MILRHPILKFLKNMKDATQQNIEVSVALLFKYTTDMKFLQDTGDVSFYDVLKGGFHGA